MSSELKSIRNRLAGLLRDVDALLANGPATSTIPPWWGVSEEELFETWWKLYPRKEAKGGGRAAYKVAFKKVGHGPLMAGLKGYTFTDDKKYIPLATTWLNQERWADEQVQRTSPTQAGSSDSYADVLGDLFRESDPSSGEDLPLFPEDG